MHIPTIIAHATATRALALPSDNATTTARHEVGGNGWCGGYSLLIIAK